MKSSTFSKPKMNQKLKKKKKKKKKKNVSSVSVTVRRRVARCAAGAGRLVKRAR